MIAQLVFWLLALGIAYTYFIYPLILALIKYVWKPKGSQPQQLAEEDLPSICLLIPAYNERQFVEAKIRNTHKLNYPAHLLQVLWITDGSDDGTPEVLRSYPEMEVQHQPERRGKIAAMNRGIHYVKAPIVVFTDANTYLGKNTLRKIAFLFTNEQVGCVAGEKRIFRDDKADAVSSGEGLYWRYESAIKRLEASLGSVVGAAGELFAIRRKLYQPVEADTLLDDFVISMRIAMKGYHISYSPQAYAIEYASVNIPEEMKRKIRIASGGFQTLFRLKGLFRFMHHKYLTWAYISHKVMRWAFVPLALPVVFFLNAYIAWQYPAVLYTGLLVLQLLFYLMALTGALLQNRSFKKQWFFAPYYVLVMNLAMYFGFFRYLHGKAPVNWERARRNK